jgi:hypothetical protein
VGSQYPLSKPGSVVLTQELYSGLFRGEDPRQALYSARQELNVRMESTHDWASLVAYTALPDDLADQLVGVRLRQSLKLLEGATKKWRNHADPNQVQRRIDLAIALLEPEAREIGRTQVSNRETYAEACGLLGSAFKRKAEGNWQRGLPWRPLLEQARDWYERGHADQVLRGGAQVAHWTTTQYLSLCAVLDGHLSDKDHLWRRARVAAEAERYCAEFDAAMWALGSLLELWLLRPLTKRGAPPGDWQTSRNESLELAKEFTKWAHHDSFHIDSTLCQLRRYTGWWRQDARGDLKAIADHVESLIAIIATKETPKASSSPAST